MLEEEALGTVKGFFGGAFSRENPFKTASEGMKSGAVTVARLVDLAANTMTYGGTREHSSTLNYGHPYGECSIVTPWKILKLVQDARIREQQKFSKAAAW